jgi:glycerol-3-phosphate acyltransferase PlsY
MLTALFIVVGYVTGGMPFAYWLPKLLRGTDIRKHGSGNVGATNVWRVFGRRLGLPVLLLDVLKAFVPALLATIYAGHLAGALTGGAAMAGHWRPPYLRFQKGGKMVATLGGALFGLAPYVGLSGAGVWLVLFFALRYVSVASIVAALSLPALAAALGEPWPVIVFSGIASVGIILVHKPNIRRLRAGTENRATLRRRKGQPAASAR